VSGRFEVPVLMPSGRYDRLLLSLEHERCVELHEAFRLLELERLLAAIQLLGGGHHRVQHRGGELGDRAGRRDALAHHERVRGRARQLLDDLRLGIADAEGKDVRPLLEGRIPQLGQPLLPLGLLFGRLTV
jgi:hypothetical protein